MSLEQVSTYHYLRVEVDINLSFAYQTQRVVGRAKSAIAELNRAFRKWALKNCFRGSYDKNRLSYFFIPLKFGFPLL
jgi:hypothetical protein